MTHSIISTDRKRWAVLAVTVVAQFMVILDVAVVNVALPAIGRDLRFSQAGLQWVVTAYAILFGGTLLLGGRLADLFGRRRLFVSGVALFTIASLLSGIAWSESALIAFRALQGLGGALLAPAALSIVVTTFAEGRERNLALGIWGAASGGGGAAGVLLGGVLTNYAGWSWIFFVNLPIGAAVIALAPWLLRETRAELGHRHLDVAGATTVTGGLMLLVYGITRATERGWGDASALASIAVAGALVGAFLAIEHRSPAPLLPLRVFRLRSLAAANATMLAVGAVAFGEFFLMTLYLQEVLGYSAIETGLAFVAITGAIAISSNLGQALTTRLGPRAVLSAGLTACAAAAVLYARMPLEAHYAQDVLPGLVIGGIGLGLSFVPVTIAAMSGVAPADAGVASGLINTSRQVGGSLGLAAVTTVAATVSSDFVQAHPGVGRAAALSQGFSTGFYVLAAIALAGAGVAALFAAPAPRTQAEPEPAPEAEPAWEEAA